MGDLHITFLCGPYASLCDLYALPEAGLEVVFFIPPSFFLPHLSRRLVYSHQCASHLGGSPPPPIPQRSLFI